VGERGLIGTTICLQRYAGRLEWTADRNLAFQTGLQRRPPRGCIRPRCQARNAGFSDYRSFRWQELARFYYTPNDCKAFHAAILEVVVPAVGRISQTRKANLSVESLTVWDDFWHWAPDPLGRAPLRPFQSVHQMTAALQQLFTRLDPVLGSYYQTLREEQLMDLEARQFKAPGAYMQELPASRRPFVFSNSVGLHYDVLAQFHESGHAFHVFESAHWPFHYQSMIDHAATEFAEVASMSMELLASQYMTTDRGGFYAEHESAQARIGQLTQILKFWPYMAVVDGFQHWVYENPDLARDTARCDEHWASLHRLFLPHLDWSGVEETLGLCWRLQDHILLSPFYYIEYGIAQLGAIQIWVNSLAEPAAALRAYRSALALGNTAALPELFRAAGTKFAFDVETLREATALIERTINELQTG
jgi:oligoendopeptidase F